MDKDLALVIASFLTCFAFFVSIAKFSYTPYGFSVQISGNPSIPFSSSKLGCLLLRLANQLSSGEFSYPSSHAGSPVVWNPHFLLSWFLAPQILWWVRLYTLDC